jgi:hypothetical protein
MKQATERKSKRQGPHAYESAPRVTCRDTGAEVQGRYDPPAAAVHGERFQIIIIHLLGVAPAGYLTASDNGP